MTAAGTDTPMPPDPGAEFHRRTKVAAVLGALGPTASTFLQERCGSVHALSASYATAISPSAPPARCSGTDKAGWMRRSARRPGSWKGERRPTGSPPGRPFPRTRQGRVSCCWEAAWTRGPGAWAANKRSGLQSTVSMCGRVHGSGPIAAAARIQPQPSQTWVDGQRCGQDGSAPPAGATVCGRNGRLDRAWARATAARVVIAAGWLAVKQRTQKHHVR